MRAGKRQRGPQLAQATYCGWNPGGTDGLGPSADRPRTVPETETDISPRPTFFHSRRVPFISTVGKSVTNPRTAFTPRALGTGRRCRQSLHGPCHCSNGTGLSSRMMLALFAAAPTTRSPDRSCCSAGARRSRSLVERTCCWDPHAHHTHWLSRRPHSVACVECGRRESQCVGCACGSQTHFSFHL